MNNNNRPHGLIHDSEGEPYQPRKHLRQSTKVLIEIGPGPKQYIVHQDLVTQHSDFFRNSFRNNWIESEDRRVALPYFEPTIFDMFLAWAQEQTLPVSKWEILEAIGYPHHKFPHMGPLHLDPYNVREAVEIASVKMIELGSYLGADEFVKTVHNQFVDRSVKGETRITYGAVIYAYSVLPAGHLLLRFLVDAQYHYHDPAEDDEEEEAALKEALPEDFLSALSDQSAVLGIDSSMIYDATTALARSDFHIHDDDTERQRCGC